MVIETRSASDDRHDVIDQLYWGLEDSSPTSRQYVSTVPLHLIDKDNCLVDTYKPYRFCIRLMTLFRGPKCMVVFLAYGD